MALAEAVAPALPKYSAWLQDEFTKKCSNAKLEVAAKEMSEVVKAAISELLSDVPGIVNFVSQISTQTANLSWSSTSTQNVIRTGHNQDDVFVFVEILGQDSSESGKIPLFSRSTHNLSVTVKLFKLVQANDAARNQCVEFARKSAAEIVQALSQSLMTRRLGDSTKDPAPAAILLDSNEWILNCTGRYVLQGNLNGHPYWTCIEADQHIFWTNSAKGQGPGWIVGCTDLKWKQATRSPFHPGSWSSPASAYILENSDWPPEGTYDSDFGVKVTLTYEPQISPPILDAMD